MLALCAAQVCETRAADTCDEAATVAEHQMAAARAEEAIAAAFSALIDDAASLAEAPIADCEEPSGLTLLYHVSWMFDCSRHAAVGGPVCVTQYQLRPFQAARQIRQA